MKKVLITGANSYIGTNFESWAKGHYPSELSIDTIDMISEKWREKNFSGYDCIFHVAGIAHADYNDVTEERKNFYYKINTDLAIETAQKAKDEGVKQFVLMSSMLIYSSERITRTTEPEPPNFYGDSKWQADKGVRQLSNEKFIVSVIRPPMIYGKGSKGNYPKLSLIAKKFPFFPDIKNERSMLFIENLCEFVCQIIIRREGGIFFPQNAEYSRTSDIVHEIARVAGHKIFVSKYFNGLVWLAMHFPNNKVKQTATKAFSNFIYEQDMSSYDFEYRVADFKTSIKKTESN